MLSVSLQNEHSRYIIAYQPGFFFVVPPPQSDKSVVTTVMFEWKWQNMTEIMKILTEFNKGYVF